MKTFLDYFEEAKNKKIKESFSQSKAKKEPMSSIRGNFKKGDYGFCGKPQN